MRSSPVFAIAWLLCLLAPAPALAQRLGCNPCSHPFGQVQVGTSSSFTFTLFNTGGSILRIASKSQVGSSSFAFSNLTLPMKLKPGASFQLTVTFTPAAKGYVDSQFTLTSNDPRSPMVMHVHGMGVTGTAAQLTVSPSSLNFGKVTVGSSTSLQASLAASGAAVTITSDGSTSSEFAIVGLSLPVTVQVGKPISVTLQFTPNASGNASGNAGFTSNAINSPTVAQLSGTGVAAGSHSVYLSWDAGSGSAVGYNIYRGTAKAGPFTEINTALDASTNYTDSTVVSGTTYFYVTTEVNAQGQESGYSNEVQAVIPSP